MRPSRLVFEGVEDGRDGASSGDARCDSRRHRPRSRATARSSVRWSSRTRRDSSSMVCNAKAAAACSARAISSRAAPKSACDCRVRSSISLTTVRALLFELGLALAQPAPLVVAWLRLFDLVLLTLDLAPKLPKLEKLLAVPLELQRLLRGNPFEDCELLMQPSFPCAQQLDLQLLLTAFTLDELQFLGRVQGGEVRPFGAFDRVRQGRSRLAAYGCCGGKLIPQLHLGKGEGSFAFHVDHAM